MRVVQHSIETRETTEIKSADLQTKVVKEAASTITYQLDEQAPKSARAITLADAIDYVHAYAD